MEVLIMTLLEFVNKYYGEIEAKYKRKMLPEIEIAARPLWRVIFT